MDYFNYRVKKRREMLAQQELSRQPINKYNTRVVHLEAVHDYLTMRDVQQAAKELKTTPEYLCGHTENPEQPMSYGYESTSTPVTIVPWWGKVITNARDMVKYGDNYIPDAIANLQAALDVLRQACEVKTDVEN